MAIAYDEVCLNQWPVIYSAALLIALFRMDRAEVSSFNMQTNRWFSYIPGTQEEQIALVRSAAYEVTSDFKYPESFNEFSPRSQVTMQLAKRYPYLREPIEDSAVTSADIFKALFIQDGGEASGMILILEDVSPLIRDFNKEFSAWKSTFSKLRSQLQKKGIIGEVRGLQTYFFESQFFDKFMSAYPNPPKNMEFSLYNYPITFE